MAADQEFLRKSEMQLTLKPFLLKMSCYLPQTPQSVNCIMDVFEWALKVSRKRLRASSLATYRSWFKRYAEHLAAPSATYAGSVPGSETPEQLLHALAGHGDYLTQKRTFALLGWIYSTLRSQGHPLLDPTNEIKGLFKADHRPLHLPMSETWQARLAVAAAEQANGWKRLRMIAMVNILTDTALKTTELIGLQWRDFSATLPYCLTVRSERNKTPDSRTLPLSAGTGETVIAWKLAHPAPHSTHLFVRDASGRPMDPSTVWRQIGRVTEAAGINLPTHLGTGSIRVNKARDLTNEGLSTAQVARFLGHKVERSTGELLERVLPVKGDLKRTSAELMRSMRPDHAIRTTQAKSDAQSKGDADH